MGLRKLARIHTSSSISQYITVRIVSVDTVLDDLLQRRLRVERKPPETVQPSPRPYGGRIHYI